MDGLIKDYVIFILVIRLLKRLYYFVDFGFDCVVLLKYGFWKDLLVCNKCIMFDFMFISCWYFGIWKVEISIFIILIFVVVECVEVIWLIIIFVFLLIFFMKLIEFFILILKDVWRNGFVSNFYKVVRSMIVLYDYYYNFVFYLIGKVEVLCWVRNGFIMINGIWSFMIC